MKHQYYILLRRKDLAIGGFGVEDDTALQSQIDIISASKQNPFDEAIVIKFSNDNFIVPKHLTRTIWRAGPSEIEE